MVFVLVLVVFFYGSTEHPVESLSAIFATPDECIAARSAAVAQVEKNTEVEGAAGVCMAVRGQEKI